MKLALKLSVALNVLFLLFFIGKRVYYTYGAPGKAAATNYEETIFAKASVQNQLPIDSNDVVFIGNSLTEGFPVTEYFANAKNRGVGGSETRHVLARIGPIVNGRPKKIFLEIGVNDLAAGVSINDALAKYNTIISTIQTRSPRTAIYIQSIFPVCKEYSNLLPAIKEFNSKLAQQYGHIAGITYLNIYPSLVKNNKLDSALTHDGIHLNAKGYQIWKKEIEHAVN